MFIHMELIPTYMYYGTPFCMSVLIWLIESIANEIMIIQHLQKFHQ